MGGLSRMKAWFCFLWVAGCAQPAGLHPTNGATSGATSGGGGHRDGGLMFDDGGSPQYQTLDMTSTGPLPDPAEPAAPDLATWHDLAVPPGVDLAPVPALPHASVETCF